MKVRLLGYAVAVGPSAMSVSRGKKVYEGKSKSRGPNRREGQEVQHTAVIVKRWRVGWNQVHAGAGTTVLRNGLNMGHECPQGGGKGSSTVGVPAVKDGDRVMREGRNNAGTSDNTKQTISISPLTKFLFLCFPERGDPCTMTNHDGEEHLRMQTGPKSADRWPLFEIKRAPGEIWGPRCPTSPRSQAAGLGAGR
ncbi:hypothetical protein DFH94DRAFT_842229 [Russula ochroleuca]|uniref:Uncharacterized protein n=1 Tax=Russula ochroleuca TaxID=152965 RepID=A0A9P5N4S9_9AGAM|nr:hypothetical protein DFH94DRAFT_842229 [Russula ochroleuca]